MQNFRQIKEKQESYSIWSKCEGCRKGVREKVGNGNARAFWKCDLLSQRPLIVNSTKTHDNDSFCERWLGLSYGIIDRHE